MSEQDEQVGKRIEVMDLDSETVASLNGGVNHSKILSNEAHPDVSRRVHTRQPSHQPFDRSGKFLTNKATPVDYPFLQNWRPSRKLPTNKPRPDDYSFHATLEPSRQFALQYHSSQQQLHPYRDHSVLPTRNSGRIGQPRTGKKDDAYWMAKRATLRVELEEAENECRERGLGDEDSRLEAYNMHIPMKRGLEEDDQGHSQTSKKVRWSSIDIAPSSSGSSVKFLSTPQKLRWLAPKTTASTSTSEIDLTERLVAMDSYAPSSRFVRKPYSASPLPEWLQAEIRTTVCGIYTPSRLPAGADPKEAWLKKAAGMPYTCVICAKPGKSIGQLKSHFYICVQKNGNPNGDNWFDSPTILNEYQRQVDKRGGRPWKTQSKPWKVEMGHRQKSKKVGEQPGEVRARVGEVSNNPKDKAGVEGPEGVEGAVEEGDQGL